ncbi:hypothetical protein BFP72_00700 [Reichenbachiella sp. 5M10]|uniref:CsgG/HfaB family protein n=1 Tax=Reichenbachiella sp. 5M10 TaxID=1889772 RepID=UPI000C1496B6|nr:CsgG/HfaB family protein [Reichenbachiella sp. 5M10]PIB34051.1 hypothetical protein BFP72_00700 [Reichenbachiella sp. 5M10]
MRSLLFLALALAFTSPLLAQKSYVLYPFDIQMDEGENYYEREAKRNFESGKNAFENTTVPEKFTPGVGLLNAAKGLQIAKRKGSISDLQELLRSNYEWVTNSFMMQIEDLKKASEEFEGDVTANQKADIINYYTLISKYNRILRSTNPEKFEAAKKKDPPLNLNLVDVSADLAAAESSLNETIEAAAAMHYANARKDAQLQGLESSKSAAKSFRYAYEYVPAYRDSEERYLAAKKLGTTRLGLTEFENISSSDHNAGGSIAFDILSYFTKYNNNYEFFELLDRDATNRILDEQKLSVSGLMQDGTTAQLGELVGVNSILVGTVTLTTYDTERLDPKDRSYEKKIKVGEETYMEDGKEKTRDIKKDVTVQMHQHIKIAKSTVAATFKIIDVTTGQVLVTDEVNNTADWSGVWYTYEGGDKRAIPSNLNRDEVQYIGSAQLIKQASEEVANRIIRRVSSYAKEVSK